MTCWLLTGGAGYIGSHVARVLLAAGRDVVVVDDLSTGHRDRIPDGARFVELDVLATQELATVMREHDVTGVIHLAAKKAVGESVEQPLFYYHENVGGIVSLLGAMNQAAVSRIVYSSSAAVYGDPKAALVTEDLPTVPTSPYGETKLAGEWLVRDMGAAAIHRGESFAHISLRYFNVAGAGAAELGDTSVANLIPLAFRAIKQGAAPKVFGADYPTPDGTCVRDYIHVSDLADAHVAAALRCEQDGCTAEVLNVGTGRGYSVREVLDVVAQVTEVSIPPEITERRAGDPPSLVAATRRIDEQLDWRARRGLFEMVESAWAATREQAS